MYNPVHELFLFSEMKQGKTYAFDFFFHYYYPGLCVYAQNLINRPLPDAQNIVQDVYMKFWEDREKINIQSSVRAYFFAMVRNKCLDTLKSSGYKMEANNLNKYPDIADNQFDTYIFAELEHIVKNGMLKLPDRCREVFELSRFEGLKNKEIANRLDISEKTVENQMTKALKVLRNELKDYLPLLLLFPKFHYLQ
jgi:RNA polymerase sigma-70 factor, ECF subfamily